MIIDVSNTLPELLLDNISSVNMRDLEQVTTSIPKWSSLAGWSKEELREKLQTTSLAALIDELLEIMTTNYSFENLRAVLKEQNIKCHAINLHCQYINFEEDYEHSEKIEKVTNILEEFPQEFIGFIGYNPNQIEASLPIVEKALNNGFKGVTIKPSYQKMKANDERYDALYALCEERDIPVWIRRGREEDANESIYIDHPKHLEDILIKYPNIKIISDYVCWPWLSEMVILLIEYKNLYVDTSAFMSKYMNDRQNGGHLFTHYANTLLQNQILFSSDWLESGIPIERFLKSVEQWPLKEEVREKFYWKNAAQLFKLKLE